MALLSSPTAAAPRARMRTTLVLCLFATAASLQLKPSVCSSRRAFVGQTAGLLLPLSLASTAQAAVLEFAGQDVNLDFSSRVPTEGELREQKKKAIAAQKKVRACAVHSPSQ